MFAFSGLRALLISKHLAAMELVVQATGHKNLEAASKYTQL